MSSLYRMRDEPVADRIPFLSIGNLTLEFTAMGRGKKRDGKLFSYVTFKVLESDTAANAVGTPVTKWYYDGSFSVQKDLKGVVGALTNTPASELDFADVVPLFFPDGWTEKMGEPEFGAVSSGTEQLAGRKVRVRGYFKKDKDGNLKEYPQHDFFAIAE